MRSGVQAGPISSQAVRVSRLRNALSSAASKVRPIAITSPVLFMVMPSCGPQWRNLSKGQRGSLTTT